MDVNELQKRIWEVIVENMQRDARTQLDMLSGEQLQLVLEHLSVITELVPDPINTMPDSVMWTALFTFEDVAGDIHDRRAAQA